MKYVAHFIAPVPQDSMEYDIGADESVSMAVVRAVSAVEGRDPTALPPLGAVLDTDALDSLFESRSGGRARTGGRVSFVYSSSRITIDDGEYITVEPLEVRFRERAERPK